MLTTKTRITELEKESEEKNSKLTAELELLRRRNADLEKEKQKQEAPIEDTNQTSAGPTEKEKRLAANNKLLNDLLSQTRKDKQALQSQVGTLLVIFNRSPLTILFCNP